MSTQQRAFVTGEQSTPYLAVELSQIALDIARRPLSMLAEKRARAAILDVIACMVAGREEGAVRAVWQSVQYWGEGRAGVVGDFKRISAPFAALVNGTAAHVLDFDDNFFPAITHASAVLVPALLAIGDERNGDLDQLISAYIAGLEVQAILGELMNPEHYELGWHATSTLGTIGAAAAVAVFMKLPASQVRHAISLAASLASGSKKQFGSSAKPVHAGYAAMHGVLAARLAESGIDANAGVFEGPWGFLSQFTHGRSHALPSWKQSRTLHIEEQGLTAKLYPSCMSSHLGIDGILALRGHLGFQPEQIAEIEIEMPLFMIENLRFPKPATREQARFSMHYCAAIAAIDGPPRLHHFAVDEISRPDLVELATKVRMTPRKPSQDAAQLPWGGDAEVTIRMVDGTQFTACVAYPKGSHGHPMSEAEQEQKFRDCCEGFADPARISAFYTGVMSIGSRMPLRTINAFLAGLE